MSYTEIVNLVFTIMGGGISLLLLHFIIFGIVGVFKYKKFPKAQILHKYGIVISARNEEQVIGNLIKSIQKSNYPQDLLQIFVVAHNCTDKTAEIARSLGATVYEYDNPKEKTKGFALHYIFDCIKKDYGIESFEGYFIFDADNILGAEYFNKMNDAFEAGGCKSVVTSFRNSKNFGSNLMSGFYGILFMNNCRLESRGRTVCGCSTRVQGTGYVMSADMVKDGWQYVTLTEDWEFSADEILRGKNILYCDEAVFYDEQPTTCKVMLRQRLRWAKGHLLVFYTKAKALFKSLFARNKKEDAQGSNKFSKFDILMNIVPIWIVTSLLGVLNIILLALGPLFGVDSGSLWKDWAIKAATGLGLGYISLVLNAAIIFILERKRIKNVSAINKILISLFWPIFTILSVPIELVALFAKNIGWKTIPHKDTTDFETLNDRCAAAAEIKSEAYLRHSTTLKPHLKSRIGKLSVVNQRYDKQTSRL